MDPYLRTPGQREGRGQCGPGVMEELWASVSPAVVKQWDPLPLTMPLPLAMPRSAVLKCLPSPCDCAFCSFTPHICPGWERASFPFHRQEPKPWKRRHWISLSGMGVRAAQGWGPPCFLGLRGVTQHRLLALGELKRLGFSTGPVLVNPVATLPASDTWAMTSGVPSPAPSSSGRSSPLGSPAYRAGPAPQPGTEVPISDGPLQPPGSTLYLRCSFFPFQFREIHTNVTSSRKPTLTS